MYTIITKRFAMRPAVAASRIRSATASPALGRRLLAAAMLSAALLAGWGGARPARAADVGVSVSVGQPGFYGRIDIGAFPQPVLMYPQPVIAMPPAVVYPRAPIYLHVPPGHARAWGRYCGYYNACNQPVYFVDEGWYQNVYSPRYHEYERGGYGPGREREERGERGWGPGERGRGHGRGRDRD